MAISEALIPLLVAAISSACLTPLMMKMGIALGVVDRPNQRKVSFREQIPLMGGPSIFIGCLLGLLSSVFMGTEPFIFQLRTLGFLSGGLILLLVGLWDDRFYLSPWRKLPFQILAAVIAIWAGFSIDYFTNPFTLTTHAVPAWVGWPATLLWILLVTNALNLIDGLDGLASGIGAIVAMTLVTICWQANQFSGALIGIALLGALVGFLPFNFPPARVFLGDSGAYFVGFSLSLLAVQGYRKEAILTFLVPLLALAVPLLDVVLSVLRRIRRRQRIFSPDNMHVHHRLLRKEGTHRRAVLWLYFQAACFGLIAVSFSRLSGVASYILLIVVGILTIRLLRNLGLFSIESDETEAENSVESTGTE
ncbi:MAG: MraY family glycosyltransferase [Myxococcota bacterium]